MIQIEYERYVDDSNLSSGQKSFRDLAGLEDWIFGQMRQDYSADSNAMSFPTEEKMARLKQDGPCRISFRPDRYGETISIRQIKTDDGKVVFSDGTYTSGQKFWGRQARKWLEHCERRRRNPTFDFAEDGETGTPSLNGMIRVLERQAGGDLPDEDKQALLSAAGLLDALKPVLAALDDFKQYLS